MGILNKEELRKQIRERKEVSLDGILDEFKVLLKEALQTVQPKKNLLHIYVMIKPRIQKSKL